jgi:hypothetical protein
MAGGLKHDLFSVNHCAPLTFLFEHDLFRKPVPTFRDHALAEAIRAEKPIGAARTSQNHQRQDAGTGATVLFV